MEDVDCMALNDSNQDNNRKLFVGGLSWETSADGLRSYMSRYGEVVDCSVKIDIATGRSRGFGFVMFKNPEEADLVLKSRPHMLDGKIIDPKKAVGMTKTGLPITKKIFVGGVRSETSDDQLRSYFSQFGTVHSIDFPIDHNTNKRRGFCFLEFDEPEAAEKAMSVNFHPVASQTVEVKPAYTKEQQQTLMARGMWPPPSGVRPNQAFNLSASQFMDPSSQDALKSLMNQSGQAQLSSSDPNCGLSSQYNQMAAAALFYQTYLQYAMSIQAASLVTAPTATNKEKDQIDNLESPKSEGSPSNDRKRTPPPPPPNHGSSSNSHRERDTRDRDRDRHRRMRKSHSSRDGSHPYRR